VLSRDRAADLIRADKKFQTVDVGNLDIMKVDTGTVCAPANATRNFDEWFRNDASSQLPRLVDEKLLEVKNPRRVSRSGYDFNAVACRNAMAEVSGKHQNVLVGDAMAWGAVYWQWDQRVTSDGVKWGLSPDGGEYPIQRKYLKAVTGIAPGPSKDSVIVEYEWKAVATPMGRNLGIPDDFKFRTGRATLVRFDDGSWRVEEIEFYPDVGHTVALNR
jgi:hypothetical protein